MAEAQPDLLVFPEMCITGYSCGDLFHNTTLLQGALDALQTVARATARGNFVLIAGLPMRVGNVLYNCAAAMCGGRVCDMVPKTYVHK